MTNRIELLERCAALLYDAQDMMSDGPDDSDVAWAQGKLSEAADVARQIHRLPDETKTMDGARDRWHHLIHCNAGRRTPLGGDMCICLHELAMLVETISNGRYKS